MGERYARQMVMPEIGISGQEKLRESRVFVVGAGGLGSPLLIYLAAAGVGHIGIMENDRLSLSNLNRQVLYTADDLGHSKALTAVKHLQEFNPEIQVTAYVNRFTPETASKALGYDAVVDASDNLETKSLLNAWCVHHHIPLIWAAVSRFEGQMGTFVPGHACRACIFPKNPEPGTYPSPAELGVVGAAAGVMGTLQALEVIKVLLQKGNPLLDRMLIVDGYHGEFETILFDKNPTCPICSQV